MATALLWAEPVAVTTLRLVAPRAISSEMKAATIFNRMYRISGTSNRLRA